MPRSTASTRNCRAKFGARTQRSTTLALAAAGWLAISLPATAATPPLFYAAVGGEGNGEGTGNFSGERTEAFPVDESMSGGYWRTEASASETGGGLVSVITEMASQSSSTPRSVGKVQATADLHYTFVLDGPSTTEKIPVQLNAAGGITADLNYGYASLFLGFGGDGHQYAYVWDDAIRAHTGSEITSRSFTLKETYYITPGTTLVLEMQAFANVSYPGNDNGKSVASFASVDPTFTILGGYADSYHFVGLPDSAIGAPVPEPSSWAMMVAGFGFVGAWMRRRRG